LGGYVAKNKLSLVLVLLCLLASVATNLGGSYMQRGIINDFLYSGCSDFKGLALAIMKLVGVYLLGCLATYVQSAAMVRIAQRGVKQLRQDLFDKLQELPLSYFDKHPHGELMSRFTNDADNVQMALEQSLVSLFSSCLMFVGLVVLMLAINWKLFLVTGVLLVLMMQFRPQGALGWQSTLPYKLSRPTRRLLMERGLESYIPGRGKEA
jgi:ATP-binding cassette subfamily B protein